MSESAITTRGLRRWFGQVRAVDGLDLEVPRGSVFGFVGPNGAGKTTTIKMLLGLVAPQAGEGAVLGRDIRRESLSIRTRVGYVPEIEGLYRGMRVRELIAFTRRLRPAWDDAAVDRYLAMFGLPLHRRVGHLSRGMRSQLALILALGGRPDLLILDEPTTGLDPIRRQEFLGTVLREVCDRGQTVFMSSHILSEVERVADHIGIMVEGRLAASGSLDDMKAMGRRVWVRFEADLPSEALRLPGVRRVERGPDGYAITILGNAEEALARLRAIPHCALEVAGMSLDDIFREFAGPKGGTAAGEGVAAAAAPAGGGAAPAAAEGSAGRADRYTGPRGGGQR
ncbi:MAG: ABC transporter ATP-binding protein [Acetobacteraceae bacterium]|nr:ABC transporter ATP-binding protein [Acetobacteraceae bacterium]